MAPRLIYGSRPSKPNTPKTPEEPVDRSSALPRKSGIPAPPSRLPASAAAPAPSSLPRGRSKNADEKATPRSRLPSVTSSSSTERAAPKISAKKVDISVSRAAGLSSASGMGTFTEISSNPLPQRNRLRRKPSSHNQRALYTAQSTNSENAGNPETRTITRPDARVATSFEEPRYEAANLPEPSLPQASSSLRPPRFMSTTPTEFATSNSRMRSYVPRDAGKSSTPDPLPSAASAGRSCTPSTRLSESPGNFSRTSTPTSASSMSPNMIQAPKFGAIPRPNNHSTGTRPPVTKMKMPVSRQQQERTESQGLSAVRESQTSSSSSSTVKGPDYGGGSESVASSKKSRIRQPAPTPPLRLSSKRGQKPASLTSAVSSPETPSPARLSRIGRPTQLPTTSQTPTALSRPSFETQQNIAPRRPSREGTPALEHANIGHAVVQSNLPQLITIGHKRGDSQQRTTPSTSATQSARPSLSRSASITSAGTSESLQAIAPVPSASSPHLVPKESSKGQASLAMRTDLKEPPAKKDPSPLSASPARSAGRFGLFSRKLKSPSETSIASPPHKLVKKGPAAGTGHEGYGRYARRGRSTSTGTGGNRGRSTSSDQEANPMPRQSTSRKSSFNTGEVKPELDEFYKDRLEPITIGGGGKIRENRNSQTSLYMASSAQSSVASFDSSIYATSRGQTSFDLRPGVSSSQASSNNGSRELLPAPRLISTPQGIVQHGRTLAHRRSQHRSELMGDPYGVKIPYPIDTNVSSSSPAIDTYDSTVSLPQTEASFASDFSEGQEGKWLRSKKKTPDRTKSPRKWNIFRRQHRSPERLQDAPVAQDSYENVTMHTDVDHDFDPAPVAHYALMEDGEDDSDQGKNLDQILQNIENHLELEQDAEAAQERYMERQPSVLLPPPPFLTSQFEENHVVTTPKVSLTPTQSPSSSIPTLRPSRLQQVGRIPQVVSKRNPSHTPATHSFSRPFASQNPLETPVVPHSAFARPTLGLQTDPLPSTSWASGNPASAPPANGVMYDLEREQEFLRISPRKDSELTTSSSSSGILSLAPVTAITPSAQDILGEDEIWNEYDELLDRVSPPIISSPDSNPMDIWSSFPDLARTLSSPEYEYMSAIPIALSHVTSGAGRFTSLRNADNEQLFGQGHLVAPSAPFAMEENSLSSPVSLSDLYSNYGNLSSEGRSNQRLSNLTATSGSRYSSNTIISESESPLSLNTPGGKRVTQVIAQKTANASSDSLRFSALMTSRWLCYDRVLISPAQDEVLNSRQTRILVLDGLGNDDWSAYCALTYADATVYNLAPSTRKLNSRESGNADSWIPPPNLRRMSHAGIGAPFPFPKGFFTAVVFRFPAADTPSAYKNAISECKRVLKPGGYLELCILDIDMRNTGTRARRAVRSVKERLSSARPEVSLSPTSDTVNKLLGRRGFENLNRFFVAVPLADGSLSPTNGTPVPSQGNSTFGGSKNLKDLLAGHEDLQSRRNSPKMMGRVGRWWWSRCYEKEVLDEGESSLWDDEQLIAECEERQTSLTLAICCAQKPESVRRRTVSV